ncbi:MAG: DUF72 domain-containing protein [Burkholderiales bacterium]|nr:DUF72 domain-containing protein [Burkholderiales bacterium]
MNVRVGTASWTDKTLIACGRFYPPGAKTAEGRLRFYASQFPIVEVDSSYYAMPAPATAQLWAERTPEGFVMNVKAFRLFTGHQTEPHVLHKDLQLAMGGSLPPRFFYRDLPSELIDELWKRFRECLLPLRAAGRLGLVHFQFPPWVVAGAAGRAQVEHCVQRMSGFDLSVEFRHGTWFEGAAQQRDTLGFLRELGVAHTVVDGPQGFSNSVPALWEVTHPRYALLRLHGRNRATWNVKGQTSASDRFNYDYPDAELAEMVPRIERLALTAMQTHVIFNNNMEDQGQRNARTLTDLLVAAGLR